MATKLTVAVVQNLIAEQTKLLLNEMNLLKDEVSSLKNQLAAVQNRATDDAESNSSPGRPSFADIVREEMTSLKADLVAPRCNCSSSPANVASTPEISHSNKAKELEKVVAASVKTALREDKARCEVIIEKLPEKKRDSEHVSEICTKLNVSSRPTYVSRLGKTPGDRPRPTKVTFASPFDARLFLAKFDEASKSDGVEVGAILKDTRCRPCRSSEEQSRHKVLISQMKQLNKDSKEAGRTDESFSLRNSGEIWKFTKTDNNKWRRDADWVFSLSADEVKTITSGDEAASSHVSGNLERKPAARNPSD